MKHNLKIASILGSIGILAGIFIVPYQVENLSTYLSSDVYDPNDLPFSLGILLVIAAIQIGVMTFIAAWIGISLARKVNLHMPILDALVTKGDKVQISKKWFIYAIIWGVLAGFSIVSADKFLFQNLVPILSQHTPTFSWYGLIAGILYGGVIEEVLMRLFLMSFVVWIIYKLFFKNKNTFPNGIYWVAIIIAAILFTIGHFPTTQLIFGELSTILIIRSFLLNGLFGVGFGYLYWRKGIEYAIFSHMTAHISMQLLFIPLFY